MFFATLLLILLIWTPVLLVLGCVFMALAKGDADDDGLRGRRGGRAAQQGFDAGRAAGNNRSHED